MSESDTMFNERDRRCAAVQLMISTDPSYDNRTIASTLKMQIWIATSNRDVPRVMKTKFPATVMVFGVVFKWGPHHATLHLRGRLESQHQSVPGCAEECGDLVVQSDGRWQTLGLAAGFGAGPTSPQRAGLGFRNSATTLYPSLTGPLLPRPEPAGLLCVGIRREHHQHDFPQHQSQPDRPHPPSIRRAPTGACGNGMLPIPDPYREGDWGWRRLHWIAVSSTTPSSYLNGFFQ